MGVSTMSRDKQDVGQHEMNEQMPLLAVSKPKFLEEDVPRHYKPRSHVFLAIVSAATFLLLFHRSVFDASVSLSLSDATLDTAFTAGNTVSVFDPSSLATPKTSTTAITTTTTITQYGEVWVIRHGEKHPVPPVSSSPNNKKKRLKAMYELSPEGWKRAEYLASLLRTKQWPPFRALFATQPPTPKEVEDAYPKYARDDTTQTLVWREYETLLPMSKYLGIPITADYVKGDVRDAALQMARTAIEGAEEAAAASSSSSSSGAQSPIVLVSWNHCSLTTLVVRGFGCTSTECHRCWGDNRFGDVMKLNVSLTTTTTSAAPGDDADASPTVSLSLSSKLLSMTCEDYPGDEQGCRERSDWIEASTPCLPSTCSKRRSEDFLEHCLCYNGDGGGGGDDDGGSSSSSSSPGWVPRKYLEHKAG